MLRVLLFISCVSVACAFLLPFKAAEIADTSRRNIIAGVAPALGVLLLPKEKAWAEERAPVGGDAPWVVLPVTNVAGKEKLRLEDYNGKWKVLYFYPDDQTATCSLEAKRFQAVLQDIRTLGAEIIGVSPQEPSEHQQFCSSLGLEFPLLSDAGGELAKAYGAQQEIPALGSFTNRETYIIDPMNVIRWKDKNVALAVDNHAETIVGVLKDLLGITKEL